MPKEVADSVDRLEPALWLGGRIKKFETLTRHRLFPEMYGRLISGQSVYRIVEWVQSHVEPDDPLGASSMSYVALANRLYRFKKLLPPAVLLSRGYLDEHYAAMDAGVNVLSELDTLIRVQKARIEIGIENERSFPVPIEQMGREIERLGELLTRKSQAEQLYGRIPGAAQTPAPQVTLSVANTESRTLALYMQDNPVKALEIVGLLDKIEQVVGDDDGARAEPVAATGS